MYTYSYTTIDNLQIRLLHSDELTHLFVSSLSTCPIGHEHIGTSHIKGGKGLLQVAFNGRQSELKDCPSPGHGATILVLF